jgi:hypothetical protein
MKSLSLAAALLLSATVVFAEDPATFPVGAFTFNRPADWQWVPVTSSMRKAQLKVPGTDPAQSAEVTFFHFGGGQGGDVQSNAMRWLRQFQSKEGAEKIDWKDIDGTRVALVSTEGTFQSGMPGGPTTPMPDHALLGAILPSSEGNVFVKMTGPTPIVKGASDKFIEFITAAVKSKK